MKFGQTAPMLLSWPDKALGLLPLLFTAFSIISVPNSVGAEMAGEKRKWWGREKLN